jgi:GNAT superfamily N-acetyltransferase
MNNIGPTINFIQATPHHSEELAALMRRCFLHAYSHASSPERIARYVDTAYAHAHVRSELENPHLPTWIAVDSNGAWVGFGRLCLRSVAHSSVSGQRPIELQRFYLTPDYHGTGVAAQLMSFLIAQAQNQYADVLWLNVWKDAPQAIRFYEKHGYQTVGSTVFWVDDDAKDDWVMQRQLPLSQGSNAET